MAFLPGKTTNVGQSRLSSIERLATKCKAEAYVYTFSLGPPEPTGAEKTLCLIPLALPM